MSKNWVDASEVLDNTEGLNYKLKEYKYMMQEVPKNIKEKKYSNTHRVYEKNEFIILKVHSKKKVGYILYNTKKDWENGHTHLDSFDMAKVIISDVIHHKKPKTNNTYLLRSHIRVSNDEKYIKYIKELIQTKKSKNKQEYYNRIN